MNHDITFPAAALAGLLSFLSPCVLPLVPPYLCFLAGTTLEDLTLRGEAEARKDAVLAGLLFVFGFSTVFTALGAAAFGFQALVGPYLYWLGLAAGVFLIIAGLHFLGLFRVALLYREARIQTAHAPGLWSAYVMGLTFAFGWAPCIGPILVGILSLAASEATAWRGAALLGVYSLGLGVPFLIAACVMGPFVSFLKRFRAHFGLVEKVVGGLLVATGVAFLTGGMQSMSQWLLQTFPALSALG